MKWFRSLAAELFPSWFERRLLGQQKGQDHASVDSLTKLKRTLQSADIAEANHDGAKDLRRQSKLSK